jgi:hypothetical protein
MTTPKTGLRGVNDIRTRSGHSPARSDPAHKTHMRLCCLEMERARREEEKRQAMERAARCDERLGKIDSEVQRLLATLGAATTARLRPEGETGESNAPAAPVAQTRSGALLRHTY